MAGPTRVGCGGSRLLALGLGALGRRRRPLAGAKPSRPRPPGPSATWPRCSGNVGHRLRGTGELTAALIATGFQVASRGFVKVASFLDVEPQIRAALARCRSQRFVRRRGPGPADPARRCRPGQNRRKVAADPDRGGRTERRCAHGRQPAPGRERRPRIRGRGTRRRRLGLQSIAVEPDRAIGPVAESFVGTARGSVVAAKTAQQVVRLTQFAVGPGSPFFFASPFPLALALGDGGPPVVVWRRKHCGQPEAHHDRRNSGYKLEHDRFSLSESVEPQLPYRSAGESAGQLSRP